MMERMDGWKGTGEELLEREYLRVDGEEDEELEQQVVMIISFQHLFSFHSYCLLPKSQFF